jgi:hypothetical protein
MARIAALFSVVALVAGCAASHQYTEADHQKSVDADLGTSFTVSVPAAGDAAVKPVFSPAVLEIAPGSKNEAGRRTFEFTAKALGETEIRIGRDFSLRVRVTSASDRPGVRVHNR